MKITLKAWAEKEFDPPPSIRTLRAWASSGLIQPNAVLVGRAYYVEEDAEYVKSICPDCEDLSDRARSVLDQTA